MLRLTMVGILLLSQETRTASQNAMAHLGKGTELMRSERYQEAAKQFQEAVNGDANRDQARLNLAICDIELRDYTVARPLFSSMTGLKDQARAATYYLGRIDLLEDRLDSAIT